MNFKQNNQNLIKTRYTISSLKNVNSIDNSINL